MLPYSLSDNAEPAKELCEHLIKYLEESGRPLVSGERVAWGTSTVRFEDEGEFLVAYGLNIPEDRFERGIDDVLVGWRRQQEVCDAHSSEYVATNLEQLMAVSADIAAGGEVAEGVRYPVSGVMSGWWLFGVGFNGNMESVKPVHVGHIVVEHGEVVPYLALKPGFAFRLSPKPYVWLDPQVAATKTT